jgi:DNA-binding beta-propeller fold protein YncE
MRRFLTLLIAAAFLTGLAIAAQNAPELAFDSAANPLTLPDDIYLGEVGGVAANSKGDIFVFTRTGHPTISLGTSRAFAHGGSRLFQFDRTGKFKGEIGANSYAFMFAQQIRIDPQDNLWIVDQMTNSVVKLDSAGHLQLLLGRKPEAIPVPAAAPRGGGEGGGGGGGARGRGGLPGEGAPQDVFNRPTDVAWDAAGNIFVADGFGNARVAKFNNKGVFTKSWGSRGTGKGQFATVNAIAVDTRGNVYVADAGNKRIQVFDNDGNFKTQYTNVGAPAALCITPGPNQVLFSSNSNPPEDIDVAGEIYKINLDGSVIGKFGKAGKMPKEFGTVNSIDCRTDNNLLVGEIGNMRVQKLTLH